MQQKRQHQPKNPNIISIHFDVGYFFVVIIRFCFIIIRIKSDFHGIASINECRTNAILFCWFLEKKRRLLTWLTLCICYFVCVWLAVKMNFSNRVIVWTKNRKTRRMSEQNDRKNRKLNRVQRVQCDINGIFVHIFVWCLFLSIEFYQNRP